MNDPEEPESKSARKRAMHELQHMAEDLAQLSVQELRRLAVDADTLNALRELAQMKPGGARNRQVRFCARLLDRQDWSQLRAYLDNRQSARLDINRRFHELEVWRDRLLADGDHALTAYLEANPQADRQALRQLVRAARQEVERQKPPTSARKLFKILRRQAGLDD